MIEREQLEVGGGMVLWSLSEWTDQTRLKAGLGQIGLGELAPEIRSPGAVLKDTLEALYGKPNVLIRPLATKDGYCVQQENRGTVQNTYDQLLGVKVDETTEHLNFDPYDNRAYDVQNAFLSRRHLIKNAQVTSALVRIVDKLGGTRLKPGVYWLPEFRLRSWKAVAEKVEDAAAPGPHNVYLLRNVLDADAIRCVKDAIVQEMTDQARLIEHDILANDLGDRALEHRGEECQQMLAKLQSFESLLHVSMESVRELVVRTKQNAITAKLLREAQPA